MALLIIRFSSDSVSDSADFKLLRMHLIQDLTLSKVQDSSTVPKVGRTTESMLFPCRGRNSSEWWLMVVPKVTVHLWSEKSMGMFYQGLLG